jgi:hypothetical protein
MKTRDTRVMDGWRGNVLCTGSSVSSALNSVFVLALTVHTGFQGLNDSPKHRGAIIP